MGKLILLFLMLATSNTWAAQFKPPADVNVVNTPTVTVTNPQTSVTVDNAASNPVPVTIQGGVSVESPQPIRYLWMANNGINDNGTCSFRLQSLDARQEIAFSEGPGKHIVLREIGSAAHVILLNYAGNQDAIDLFAQTFVALNGLTGDLAVTPTNSNGLLDCEDWNRKVLGIPEIGN